MNLQRGFAVGGVRWVFPVVGVPAFVGIPADVGVPVFVVSLLMLAFLLLMSSLMLLAFLHSAVVDVIPMARVPLLPSLSYSKIKHARIDYRKDNVFCYLNIE
jgi:hypothetical protein